MQGNINWKSIIIVASRQPGGQSVSNLRRKILTLLSPSVFKMVNFVGPDNP